MDLGELVRALMRFEARAARQWVADALARKTAWADLPRPEGLTESELCVAAGVVELLASREHATAPDWTGAVGAAPEVIWLIRVDGRPRLRQRLLSECPEPLRRRRVFAPDGFLSVA
jgi:hypothetical protein